MGGCGGLCGLMSTFSELDAFGIFDEFFGEGHWIWREVGESLWRDLRESKCSARG